MNKEFDEKLSGLESKILNVKSVIRDLNKKCDQMLKSSE